MHKDLFSLTLTLSCRQAGATWPLGVKGKLTTSPHSLPSSISPPGSGSRQAENATVMDGCLWPSASCSTPSQAATGGRKDQRCVCRWGTGDQPLLPLSRVAWQPEGRGPEEWESVTRQGGNNGTGEAGLKPSESYGHTDTQASGGGSSGCEPRKQEEARSLQTLIFSILLF